MFLLGAKSILAKHIIVLVNSNLLIGPWIVLRRLKGASYECKHSNTGKVDKFHASHLSPIPKELVPYGPVDGPDNQFGQLNKPLSTEAYKEAGIEGFVPPQPIQFPGRQSFDDADIPSNVAPAAHNTTHLIDFKDPDLHFPTLWELNQELELWDNDDVDKWIDDQQPVQSTETPIFATKISPIPTASRLAGAIVRSRSRLFFISWKQPHLVRREWHLVQVQLDSSISLNPTCLESGKYLVNFFICHPRDKGQHPRNQRWWLEYHASSSVARLHQGDYHLLRPDDHSMAYAKANSLHPFCQWVNLLHPATYIHGPFEFATINGRLTRDRIPDDAWLQLTLAKDKYDDLAPDLNRKDWSRIQFSRNFHSTIEDPSVQARVLATRFTQPELYSMTSLQL